jgi:hypothetical protein
MGSEAMSGQEREAAPAWHRFDWHLFDSDVLGCQLRDAVREAEMDTELERKTAAFEALAEQEPKR